MNTSANTNQIHATMTRTGRTTASGFRRRTLAGALLINAIAAAAVGLAAMSHADIGDQNPNFAGPAQTGAGCKTEPWGFLGSQRRTLCDGPVSRDGSWSRARTIWVPAHQTSYSCTTRPGRYSSSSCSGGYFIPQSTVSSEVYPVRSDTVLPDEPGHLG